MWRGVPIHKFLMLQHSSKSWQRMVISETVKQTEPSRRPINSESEEAPTDSSTSTGAACWGGWKSAIPASHWDLQVTLGELERLCEAVCQVTHTESSSGGGTASSRGSVGWPPPRSHKGDKHCICKQPSPCFPLRQNWIQVLALPLRGR